MLLISDDPIVNKIAFVPHDMKPGSKGRVKHAGVWWPAISHDCIAAGNHVLVMRRDGLTLTVKPIGQGAGDAAPAPNPVVSPNQQ